MANVRNISALGTDMVNPTNHPSNQWGNDVPGPLREIGSPKNNPKKQKVQDAKFHKPRSLLGALYFICWIYHQNIYTIFPGFHWPWSRFIRCPGKRVISLQTRRLGQGVQHIEITAGHMLKVTYAKFPSGSSHCTSQWATDKTNQHLNIF